VSPGLYSSSVQSPNETYGYPEFERAPLTLTASELLPKSETLLSARRILLHSILFILTAFTTTLTGAAWSIESQGEPGSIAASLLAPHVALFRAIAAGHYEALLTGLLFSSTLLLMLGAHEFGHYFACRFYGIRATLPFFIPAPPAPLTPFGTFGAVIKIKDPITSRRALFDIGIAGPLAGFALAIPASLIGLMFAKAAPVIASDSGAGFQMNDPLLFVIITRMFGLPHMVAWNPIWLASWAVLLVTSLNLFPVGQLDGGHVLYAVTGPRIHKWVSRIVCAAVGVLAIVSLVRYHSPIWILWTFVLLFLLRAGHPPTLEDEPLGAGRIALAVLAILVFLVCFMPFPMSIS
jgi:membrane-associated protease RseP (regulator of RpoE activity)